LAVAFISCNGEALGPVGRILTEPPERLSIGFAVGLLAKVCAPAVLAEDGRSLTGSPSLLATGCFLVGTGPGFAATEPFIRAAKLPALDVGTVNPPSPLLGTLGFCTAFTALEWPEVWRQGLDISSCDMDALVSVLDVAG
jgi:hypothetical protein